MNRKSKIDYRKINSTHITDSRDKRVVPAPHYFYYNPVLRRV